MTKKKAPSLLDNKYTPAIPHNAGGRILIMGWMNNRKRGAPPKITPTNNKMKSKGRAPMKAAAASTASKKKPPAKILHPQKCLHQELQVGSTKTVNSSLTHLYWTVLLTQN